MNKPFLALLAAAVIWGAAPPVFRLALQNIPLFSLAFLRFGIAALLLYPLVRKEIPKLSRFPLLAIGYLLLAGLLGVTLNIAFFFWGLKLSTALNAGLLIGTIPLFSVAAGVLFLKEETELRVWLGALLGFLGIVFLIGSAPTPNLGDLLLLAAVFAWVAYEILSKNLMKVFSPALVTFFSFWTGALTFLPAAAWEYLSQPTWIAQLDYRGWLGIAFGALLSSFTAYLLWQWGLARSEVQRAGIFLYVEPVVAAILAVILLGEIITPAFLVAALLIFSGLWLSQRRSGPV